MRLEYTSNESLILFGTPYDCYYIQMCILALINLV